jgi:signal transduction histidine kinase/ActR/RegA family two-component response regulator
MIVAREVSSRAFDLYLRILARAGIDASRFIEGIDVTEEDLKDPSRRVSWTAFCLLTERLEAICGGADALEEAGAMLTDAPALKAVLRMAALFTDIQKIYWTGHKFVALRLFSVLQTEYEVLSPSRLRLSVIIPEPHRVCHSFFRLNAGTFRAAPRILGLPDAVVATTIRDRRCDYIIEHAPSTTLWSRIRHALIALLSARAVYEELRSQNDELRAQLQELSSARRVEHEASRLKATFLANMTHEIRTPMNGVLGMTQLLSDSPLNAEQRSHVEVIRESASGLLALLDNVISYAQLEAQEVNMERTDFDPEVLVHGATATARKRADAKALVLRAVVDPALPSRVRGDPVLIRTGLNHLIENAVKFTDRGSVEVSVTTLPFQGDELTLRFSVKDTGVGMSDQDRLHIFHPFMQADGSLVRKYGGVGLGLAITKQLAELMGGNVSLESRIGQGSTFHLTVPVGRAFSLSSPAMHAPLAPPSGPTAPSPESAELCGKAPAPTSAADTPPAAMPAALANGLRILVAEDNLVNQKVLVNILRRLGYATDVAMNGREAVEAYRRTSYAAILMDLQMPEMTGFEAASFIRSLEDKGHIPIIAVTAHSEEEYARRAFECGMDAHLSKPIQRQRLAAELEKLIPRAAQAC